MQPKIVYKNALILFVEVDSSDKLDFAVFYENSTAPVLGNVYGFSSLEKASFNRLVLNVKTSVMHLKIEVL